MKAWRSEEHARHYLLGVYLSDGTVRAPGEFSLGQRGKENREFVWIATSALSALGIFCTLSVGPPRSSDKFKYRVRTRRTSKSKELTRWLVESTRQKSTLRQIPSCLLPEVIAGVLDGDGSISFRRRSNERLRRGISWAGKSGYVQILILQLENLNVSFGKERFVRGSYDLGDTLTRSISIRSFFSAGLFVRMPKKLDKLMGIANSYKQKAPCLMGERWLAETLPLIPRSAKEYPIDQRLVHLTTKHFHGFSDYFP